jgi:hypothetical protein
LRKTEFERQTQKKYATTIADEIHNEDLRNIQKYIEDNPRLTMEQAANIYYDVKGMGTQTMKYQRGDPLVPDHEVNKLTTFMRQLHEYYMA